MAGSTELRVLGCSGGCSPGARPTSYLLGSEVAVDAGCLASTLSLTAQHGLRDLLLTHAHFDHIRDLPLFLDNVYPQPGGPPTIHGAAPVLETLRRHILNGEVWPAADDLDPPAARYRPFPEGESRVFRASGGSFELRLLPGYHGVPAYGYLIRKVREERTPDNARTNDSQLSPNPVDGPSDGPVHALTTDTGYEPALFERLARTPDLRTLIIEASFPDRLQAIAEKSHHLTPSLLREGLRPVLDAHPELRVLVGHRKPRYREELRGELTRLDVPVGILEDGDVIRL